jgi:hypothetical protein
MRDDTDISGLDPQAAREYVLGFIKALEETRRQKGKLVEERNLWRGRVELAESQRRTDLAEKARGRMEGLQPQIDRLEAEERSLLGKVARLKERLKTLPAGAGQTLDAEQLLTELRMVVGERDDTEDKIREIEIQAKLEALKKRMENQEENHEE